jgi:molybdate transport system regulatory protein
MSGAPVFGDGKAELLEAIDRGGSLSAAARTLGMSYRSLWGRLRNMEDRLGVKLIWRRAGGGGGGGAGLTAAGRALLANYRRFRDGINALVDARFARQFRP